MQSRLYFLQKSKYDIEDEDILDAIRYHTTGNVDMTATPEDYLSCRLYRTMAKQSNQSACDT